MLINFSLLLYILEPIIFFSHCPLESFWASRTGLFGSNGSNSLHNLTLMFGRNKDLKVIQLLFQTLKLCHVEEE